MKFDRSKQLRQQAHALIPGGAHTYAKGDDQFPELAPGFIKRGDGCHVWDVDGNEFIEYGMGLRAVTLGHAYKPVVEAAYRQMLLGSNYSRPASIEVECAEEMLSIVPEAQMVKFAKDGSTVTTAAVKLARAYTGRAMVAVCAEHPFYSYNDWFIGGTPMKAGIPQVISDLTVKFHYNKIESLIALFEQYPDQIACVIMEASREEEPTDGFLHKVQHVCAEHGALFILDEMITGFRLHLGGAQAYYGLSPDLSTFGKALANGFAVSALLGKRDIMELGGIYHDRERVFLLSTTHGAENHSLAAAIATIQIYKNEAVVEYLDYQGRRLQQGIEAAVEANNLRDYVGLLGRPSNLVYYTRDEDQKPSQAFRTLFLQETIRRGVILPSLVVSFSHTDEDVDKTIEAVNDALSVYRKALDEGVEKYLVGRPVKPVFRARC